MNQPSDHVRVPKFVSHQILRAQETERSIRRMEPHLSTSDRRPLSIATMDSVSITPNPVGPFNAMLIPASGTQMYANPPTTSYAISPTPPTYYLVQQPHMIHPEHVVKVSDPFEGRFHGEEEREPERKGKRFRTPSISPTTSCTSLIPTKTPLPVFGGKFEAH